MTTSFTESSQWPAGFKRLRIVGGFLVSAVSGLATCVKSLATIREKGPEASQLLNLATYYAGTVALWTYMTFFVAGVFLLALLGMLRVKEPTLNKLAYPFFFLCFFYGIYRTMNDPDTYKILAANDAGTFIAKVIGAVVLLWGVYSAFVIYMWTKSQLTTEKTSVE